MSSYGYFHKYSTPAINLNGTALLCSRYKTPSARSFHWVPQSNLTFAGPNDIRFPSSVLPSSPATERFTAETCLASLHHHRPPHPHRTPEAQAPSGQPAQLRARPAASLPPSTPGLHVLCAEPLRAGCLQFLTRLCIHSWFHSARRLFVKDKYDQIDHVMRVPQCLLFFSFCEEQQGRLKLTPGAPHTHAQAKSPEPLLTAALSALQVLTQHTSFFRLLRVQSLSPQGIYVNYSFCLKHCLLPTELGLIHST